MKKIKYLLLTLFTIATVVSCIDEDNDELTGDAKVGGLVNVQNELLSFVVGSGSTYTANGSVFQGDISTASIDVYKSFNNSFTGSVSNEILLTTIDMSTTNAGQTASFSLSFTYENLIEGLLIDGEALPANDGELNIGDFWSLRYAANTSAGDLNYNAKTTKVAVGTRYAGVYTVVESAYWNSGGLQGGDWNGTDVIIESVDATVYRHVGLAYWADNEYYFTVDNTTGVITVLDVDLAGDGTLLNGSPIMTCGGAGGPFESISCDATTSLATPDDVNGEDQLELTVGYFRGTGATREFYEKLIKKVD